MSVGSAAGVTPAALPIDIQHVYPTSNIELLQRGQCVAAAECVSKLQLLLKYNVACVR